MTVKAITKKQPARTELILKCRKCGGLTRINTKEAMICEHCGWGFLWHCHQCGTDFVPKIVCTECHWFLCPNCKACGCDYYDRMRFLERYAFERLPWNGPHKPNTGNRGPFWVITKSMIPTELLLLYDDLFNKIQHREGCSVSIGSWYYWLDLRQHSPEPTSIYRRKKILEK